MAAPASITLKSLDGQWAMNRKLSGDYDPVLKLQGVNWLMRKVLSMASVTVTIKEWEEGGLTHIHVENRPASGLPPTTEDRIFDYKGIELAHPLFGKVRSQTRWAGAADLDEVDEFLAKGFETEASKTLFVHIMTEHLDHGVVTHQAWGFEEVEGERFQTRHIVVKKGDEVLRMMLAYDYLGPRPADEN
ncbi:hypothetical protein BP5796_12183 [Coleophoma crateriformis]|uniref:Uncharacterized protein n=1 Tax=Coleophoma crateriformis TaxID=565419 RepID=A0A3D8QBW2_9HELO|nr:hypothetical protein BP5796_12183 [Coleophoma crateriformis]